MRVAAAGAVLQRPAATLRTGARIARRAWRQALGLPPRADTADRRWLEQVLLPHYAPRTDVATVLLVGTRWYTRHYPSLLPRQRCISIDIAPSASSHGSPGGHIVDDVRHVEHHLAPASVDLVLFNGVFGWGLDDAVALDQAVGALAHVLRPRGELVFGWNDVAAHCPFDWRAVPRWKAFEPLPFAPARGQTGLTLDTDNRHRFDFFSRR
jgi:SAM-dependent methyltransferase